jgi:hypothetical protein
VIVGKQSLFDREDQGVMFIRNVGWLSADCLRSVPEDISSAAEYQLRPLEHIAARDVVDLLATQTERTI